MLWFVLRPIMGAGGYHCQCHLMRFPRKFDLFSRVASSIEKGCSWELSQSRLKGSGLGRFPLIGWTDLTSWSCQLTGRRRTERIHHLVNLWTGIKVLDRRTMILLNERLGNSSSSINFNIPVQCVELNVFPLSLVIWDTFPEITKSRTWMASQIISRPEIEENKIRW